MSILHNKNKSYSSLTLVIAGCLKILSNIQCELHAGVSTVPGDVSELRFSFVLVCGVFLKSLENHTYAQIHTILEVVFQILRNKGIWWVFS